jgi:hypothetical protein
MREEVTYRINYRDRVINNYYPFGMLEPEQIFSSQSYRFGFNGKENDKIVNYLVF